MCICDIDSEKNFRTTTVQKVKAPFIRKLSSISNDGRSEEASVRLLYTYTALQLAALLAIFWYFILQLLLSNFKSRIRFNRVSSKVWREIPFYFLQLEFGKYLWFARVTVQCNRKWIWKHSSKETSKVFSVFCTANSIKIEIAVQYLIIDKTLGNPVKL